MSVHHVLNWLNLPELRDLELERIAREYDQSTLWTENDVNEKRTTPTEFKKPAPPTQVDRLSTQIAFQEKRKEVQTQQQNREHHSTPMTHPLPILENKLSPIDKKPPTTRVHTQMLAPIEENVSFDNDEQPSQVKRRKLDEISSTFHSMEKEKNEVCLSTIDDIDEDDLKF